MPLLNVANSSFRSQVQMAGVNNSLKPGRDVHLDALRGLMLVVMTIDHFPSLISDYTLQSLGYVGAAEGFVFLSGLVAGRVYTRYGETGSRESLWRRALRRAGFIYSFHLLTFITLFSLTTLFSVNTWGLENWASQFHDRPLLALFMGITLTYQPKFLDILPMYALFILILPLAVQLAKANRLKLLLIASVAVWLLAWFGVSELLNTVLCRLAPVYLGGFDIFSWQLLFVLGVCIGIRGVPDVIRAPINRFLLITCLVGAAILFSLRHGFILKSFQYNLEAMSVTRNLGPLRVLNFIPIALLIRYMLPWLPENLAVKGLALLGRHSLEVFTFHVFLLYLCFGIFLTSQFKEAWVLLFVSSLFLPAFLLERYGNPWKTCFYWLAGKSGSRS
jgi:hypothetical protein